MLTVLKYGKSIQGVLTGTAYRGSGVYPTGFDSTTGNMEFAPPRSSADAAKCCYLVDWENHNPLVNVYGGTTSDAKDKSTATATYPRKATFHYGGWYRTDRVYSSTWSAEETLARNDVNSANAAYSGGAFQPVLPILAENGSHPGYWSNVQTACGWVEHTTGFRVNACFYLTYYDAQSAAPYGRGAFAEIRAIPHRIDAGYYNTATGGYVPIHY